MPLLTATASLATPTTSPIRLVTLPKGAEARLCAALALPRVGFLGLMDGAPHATPLVEYVREHVPSVEVPWLKEAAVAKYLPLKVSAVQQTTRIQETPERADKSTIDQSSDDMASNGKGRVNEVTE